MKIATWNVNSVRTRITHVCDWLQANPDVDVLGLQETKVIDTDFPTHSIYRFRLSNLHLRTKIL
jgi:exonuclease III